MIFILTFTMSSKNKSLSDYTIYYNNIIIGEMQSKINIYYFTKNYIFMLAFRSMHDNNNNN